MFGVDYDKLEDMTNRMEAVAASMETSSKRVLEAAKIMSANSSTDAVVHCDLHIDGKKILESIEDTGRGGSAQ